MAPQQSSINVVRRVSNLTTEQVEKKRAIDRANQRHFRAKNKTYIRSLEQKVEELTGKLKRCEDLLAQYQEQHDTTIHSRNTSSTSPADCSSESFPEQNNGLNADDQSLGSIYQDYDLEKCLDLMPLDFGTGLTINASNSAQEFRFLDLGSSHATDMLLSPVETVPDILPRDDFLLESWDMTSSEEHLPEWQMIPLHIQPMTRLDETITSTTKMWRAEIRRLSPLQQPSLDQPVFPSISSLLNRPQVDRQTQEISISDAIAAQVWHSPLKNLAERIGFMYILSHLIRWLVCRSKESYEAMPSFLRPTYLQRTVPHPPWVDTLAWPDVRDAIIQHMDWSRFEEYRQLSGGSLTVSWKHGDAKALIESPDKQTMMLHPEFEAHLRNVENWKVGKAVEEAFPFIKRRCA